MFQAYEAVSKDLEAVETGIRFSWHKRLKTVFPNRNKVAKIVVVSYDTRFAYIWVTKRLPYKTSRHSEIQCGLDGYRLFRRPHKTQISDDAQSYWRAALMPEALEPAVFSVLENRRQTEYSFVSGGLLTPFTRLQKRRQKQTNPYISSEGFYATIVHEFAHAYFDQHGLWWFSSTERNLKNLADAHRLCQGDRRDLFRREIQIPNYGHRHTLLSEAYAFCAEYSAARYFWPALRKVLDEDHASWMQQLSEREKRKAQTRADSVLSLSPGHAFAAVIGRLLLEQSPRTWMRRLLNSTTLH